MPDKAVISLATRLEDAEEIVGEELGLRGFARPVHDETAHRSRDELDMLVERLAYRERIATALADTLVSRLFEVGLWLEGALTLAEGPEVRRRVGEAIAGIDDSIRSLREVIFDLAPASSTTTTLYPLGEVALRAARGQGSQPGALTGTEEMWLLDS